MLASRIPFRARSAPQRLTLRRAKNDQEGEWRRIGILYGGKAGARRLQVLLVQCPELGTTQAAGEAGQQQGPVSHAHARARQLARMRFRSAEMAGALPCHQTRLVPCRSIQAWLETAHIYEVPVFRSPDKFQPGPAAAGAARTSGSNGCAYVAIKLVVSLRLPSSSRCSPRGDDKPWTGFTWPRRSAAATAIVKRLRDRFAVRAFRYATPHCSFYWSRGQSQKSW